MKPTEQSTTPETDAAVERIGDEPLESFTKFHKLAEFAGELESQRNAARAALEGCKAALRVAYRGCDLIHHGPNDQHAITDPCPVEARLEAALAAAEKEGA